MLWKTAPYNFKPGSFWTKGSVFWHIGTYLALLHLLRQNQGINPVTISRKIVMPIARIKSVPTYHKYMADLVRFGYIHYHPSYHPKQASKVFIIP